jgi:hypothetical protein
LLNTSPPSNRKSTLLTIMARFLHMHVADTSSTLKISLTCPFNGLELVRTGKHPSVGSDHDAAVCVVAGEAFLRRF